MSELDKYWVIEASSTLTANEKINKFEKLGYKLMDVKPYQGVGGSCFIITMYLSSTPDLGKYEGFENIEIGTPRQHEVEKLGYKALFPYSKHITWAKPRGHQPKLSVVREALINAYEVVENWDDKDDNLHNNIIEWLDRALGELDGETE